LKSYGSINGKTIDLAHLIINNIMPDTFKLDIKCNIEDVKVSGTSYRASSLTAFLTRVR